MLVRVIAENRKAKRDYEILESFEAGIALKGSEVKSIRQGKVSLQEAYADIENEEVFLYDLYIAPYEKTGVPFQEDPRRPRKLLLHKQEIKRLIGKVQQRGLTLIPLKLYLRNHLVKVELALARGKKKYEKREAIKRRLIEEEIRRAMKRSR